ncbi:cysteine hydrolase family protein [Sulfodiicoccus acidiphilus]|uniref:cysteine hydrolase family protein n=1 Tax=Sulfodiicoccus acidiphilus TaxID=1670455 RepID=UPI000F82586B|nr:isochorismatase family cysteine hydrolase [Sulfodiicoccus acidiphilus]
MRVEVPEVKIAEKVVLDPRTSAVVVVDMQNDFVRREGKLYVPSAESTILPISKLVKLARSSGSLVIYTQDWHMKDDPEFKIWGEHALAGSWGAEVVEELRPMEGDLVVKKYRYDAFFESPMDYLLRVKGVRTLVVTGTVANICVLHTAASAALRWYDVVLPKDTVSAMTEFDYYSTLRQVDFLYKGTITTSDKVSWRRED